MVKLDAQTERMVEWGARVVEAAIDLYNHKCERYTDAVTGEVHEVKASNSDDIAYIIPPIYMDALRDAIEGKP